jgi:hypothetical protein
VTETTTGAPAGIEELTSSLDARLTVFAIETSARLDRLEAVAEEFDLVMAGGAAASPVTSPAGEAAATTLLYPSLEAWVVGHFARVYARRHGGPTRWCRQWWQHAEAITRLEALWRSWETLRLEPLGMDAWLRERLDHHLPHLMSAAGPFASCTPDKHVEPADLATTPAPPGWWNHTGDATDGLPPTAQSNQYQLAGGAP